MNALVLLCLAAAQADPPARAKVELAPKDGVWVGQRVTLAVTLSTPDLFAGAPSFAVPDIPGAVVLPPSGSPVIGTETVGGTSFTTQRHEFAVYAQRAGEVRIPAFEVRFESNAGFGKPTVQRRVTTEPVSFTAKSPPGAEGLGVVVAARDLTVTETWEPKPRAAKTGDAFTRTVTITAGDVPGMVLPPLRIDAIDGLAAYPKPPSVNDRTDRGALTGRRVESVTYVCERAGPIVVPERTLTWWDVEAKELKTAKLPARTFEISPGPEAMAPATAATQPPPTGSWRPWAFGGVAFLSIGWFAVVRAWPWFIRRRSVAAESEATYFAHFRRACGTGDPHAAYRAMLAWLDRAGPVSVEQLAAPPADPRLATGVNDILARVYARPEAPPPPWDAAAFADLVAARRRTLHAPEHALVPAPLPPLNPRPSETAARGRDPAYPS